MAREDLERKTGVRDNVANRKLGWIGHVLRIDNTRICTTPLTWHPEERRKVGRRKTTWRRTTEQERTKHGWNNLLSARTVAKDRQRWSQFIGANLPVGTTWIGEVREVHK